MLPDRQPQTADDAPYDSGDAAPLSDADRTLAADVERLRGELERVRAERDTIVTAYARSAGLPPGQVAEEYGVRYGGGR